MKSAIIASVLAATATAQNFAPLEITYFYANQPQGVAAGQVDYYSLQLDVSSINGDAPASAYCVASWGDNTRQCGNTCVPYSTAVPTGSWIQCYNSQADFSSGSGPDSGFSMMLFPMFAVGNFKVELQQTFMDAGAQITSQTVQYTITNSTTSMVTCDISGSETSAASGIGQHASGYCTNTANTIFYLPVANSQSIVTTNTVSAQTVTSTVAASTVTSGFVTSTIPASTVTSTAPASTATVVGCHASSVSVSFPVQEMTNYGDEVYVVGNITQLGNWAPANAVLLSANDYTSANTLWDGGNVVIPAGTAFEYKYIQISADGTLLWECGENRVFTVSTTTCGTAIAGNNPDYFRCGAH